MKVFLIAAVTVDGFIGKHSGHFPDWTSPEDTAFFVERTKQAGVMVMGATTYQVLVDKGRTLPGRRTLVYTRSPEKFDPQLETVSEDPQSLIQRLAQEGVAELAICGGSSIYGLFLEAGVVDELFITIEPVVFGQGIPLFDRALDKRYRLQESSQLNHDTLLLHYVAQES